MNTSESRGLLVGVDVNEEWLLPWWWENFSRSCTAPVTFCDFGMSGIARSWCKERGTLLDIALPNEVANRSLIDPKRVAVWEEIHGEHIWRARRAWFKKPLACAAAPYTHNLWLDLDCEVLGSLDPLFSIRGVGIARDTEAAIQVARERGLLAKDAMNYNTGVIAFEKSDPLVALWARAAVSAHETFCSDQELFCSLVHHLQVPVVELSPLYNWRISQGVHAEAQIVHWAGAWGKEYIRKYRGIRGALHGNKLPDNK